MAAQERPLNSTTRTFETTKGTLTYAELSDLIAPKVLELLDEITEQKYINSPFDEQFIQEFHRKIVGDIMPQIAGKWRNIPVMVGNWLPPEPYEIPVRIREYVRNVNARFETADKLSLQIEALAYAEGEFLSIHPFQDFNGRTIRVLLAELMMRLDFPRIDTSVQRETKQFKKYQNALAEYDTGRIGKLVEFWEERLENL